MDEAKSNLETLLSVIAWAKPLQRLDCMALMIWCRAASLNSIHFSWVHWPTLHFTLVKNHSNVFIVLSDVPVSIVSLFCQFLSQLVSYLMSRLSLHDLFLTSPESKKVSHWAGSHGQPITRYHNEGSGAVSQAGGGEGGRTAEQTEWNGWGWLGKTEGEAIGGTQKIPETEAGMWDDFWKRCYLTAQVSWSRGNNLGHLENTHTASTSFITLRDGLNLNSVKIPPQWWMVVFSCSFTVPLWNSVLFLEIYDKSSSTDRGVMEMDL